jgi:hypothetical protein
MVLEALFHHASASRIEWTMIASGNASAICDQNAAGGQSTAAA